MKQSFNPRQLPKKETKMSEWYVFTQEQRNFIRQCNFIPPGFRAPLTHFRYGYYKQTIFNLGQFDKTKAVGATYPTKLLDFKWWCTILQGHPSENQSDYLGHIGDEDMRRIVDLFGLEDIAYEEDKNEDELKAQINQKKAELEHLNKKLEISQNNSVNLVGKKALIIQDEEDFFNDQLQLKKPSVPKTFPKSTIQKKVAQQAEPQKKELLKKRPAPSMQFLQEAFGIFYIIFFSKIF